MLSKRQLLDLSFTQLHSYETSQNHYKTNKTPVVASGHRLARLVSEWDGKRKQPADSGVTVRQRTDADFSAARTDVSGYLSDADHISAKCEQNLKAVVSQYSSSHHPDRPTFHPNTAKQSAEVEVRTISEVEDSRERLSLLEGTLRKNYLALSERERAVDDIEEGWFDPDIPMHAEVWAEMQEGKKGLEKPKHKKKKKKENN